MYGWLVKHHGRQIADEAFFRALWNLWRFAERYDDRRPAGPWFLRIAQNAARSIIRGESRQQHALLSEQEGYDPADCGPIGESDYTESEKENQRKREQRRRDVAAIVEKLPNQQRAVTKADLAHPTGTAPAADLAAALGTSKNSVYVSRNSARDAIRREMIRLGHYQEGDGGRNHAR
ncbi:MAG: hypothetical protein KIS87_02765 [Phycisphaeraceae bacterium]|nr:hypothetical protein [Phycisphaeraceae bacterium]